MSGLFTDQETTRIRDHFMEWNASERKEDFDGLDETGQDPLAQFPESFILISMTPKVFKEGFPTERKTQEASLSL